MSIAGEMYMESLVPSSANSSTFRLRITRYFLSATMASSCTLRAITPGVKTTNGSKSFLDLYTATLLYFPSSPLRINAGRRMRPPEKRMVYSLASAGASAQPLASLIGDNAKSKPISVAAVVLISSFITMIFKPSSDLTPSIRSRRVSSRPPSSSNSKPVITQAALASEAAFFLKVTVG